MPRLDFLEGKTVGVIGTGTFELVRDGSLNLIVGFAGASGVQLVPAILPHVKQLHVFSRSNCWTFPYRFKGAYTEEQKQHWSNNMEELRAYRQQLQQEEEYRFKWFITTSPGQAEMMKLARQHLESQIPESKPGLRETAMPHYAIGCRRITPSDTYFAAIADDKTEYYRDRLEKVEPGTVVLEGGKRVEGIDILVCCTGYDTSFVPSFDVVGLNGVALRDIWTVKGKNAEAFHGHSIHG